jgi:hypothetical protein
VRLRRLQPELNTDVCANCDADVVADNSSIACADNVSDVHANLDTHGDADRLSHIHAVCNALGDAYTSANTAPDEFLSTDSGSNDGTHNCTNVVAHVVPDESAYTNAVGRAILSADTDAVEFANSVSNVHANRNSHDNSKPDSDILSLPNADFTSDAATNASAHANAASHYATISSSHADSDVTPNEL